MRLIDEEYTRHPSKGSRSMRDYLQQRGHQVNRKRVQRLMNLVNSGPKFPTFSGRKLPTLRCYFSLLSVPSSPAFLFSLSR